MNFDQEKFLLGDWVVDPLHSTLTKDDSALKIEKRLMKVLLLLVQHPEKGLSKDQLLNAVWQNKVVSDETLSVAISQLRKALGCSAKSPSYIKTVSGYGYTLIQSPSPLNLQESSFTSKYLFRKEIFDNARLTLVTCICLVIVALIILFGKNNELEAEEQLVDNESFAKAFYLMQQSLGEVQQAENILTKLNEEIPNNSAILNALGKALFFQYRHIAPYKKDRLSQRAKEYVTQAININPDFADAYLQLAEIALYHENDLALAEKHYLKAIDLSPQEAIKPCWVRPLFTDFGTQYRVKLS